MTHTYDTHTWHTHIYDTHILHTHMCHTHTLHTHIWHTHTLHTHIWHTHMWHTHITHTHITHILHTHMTHTHKSVDQTQAQAHNTCTHTLRKQQIVNHAIFFLNPSLFNWCRPQKTNYIAALKGLGPISVYLKTIWGLVEFISERFFSKKDLSFREELKWTCILTTECFTWNEFPAKSKKFTQSSFLNRFFSQVNARCVCVVCVCVCEWEFFCESPVQ